MTTYTLKSIGYGEEELGAIQFLLWTAWRYRGSEGNQPDVMNDTIDEVNNMGQNLCLRKAGTERADMNGWELTESECDDIFRVADCLGLMGGLEPENTHRIDLAVILGAAEPTVRKRIEDMKAFLQNNPGVAVEKIVASGSERKLWTFDKDGNEKEPMVFTLLARRYCEDHPGEEATLWTQKFKAKSKDFFQTSCQGIEGVKDISEKTSQYFMEKYGLSWSTEKEMIEALLKDEPVWAGKVLTLMADKNMDGSRATTDQNAESIQKLVKDGDHVLVVSDGAHGVRQGITFRQKLTQNEVNLHVLASRVKTPETLEEKQVLVQKVMDEFGRMIYAIKGLGPKVVALQKGKDSSHGKDGPSPGQSR